MESLERIRRRLPTLVRHVHQAGQRRPRLGDPAAPDEALSRDSKYLYALKPGLMGPVSQVDIYRVNLDGSLTLVGNTPANGAPGQSGLAAR